MEQCNLPNEKKKDWLGALLMSNIGYCEKHHDLGFNEKNVFCVDCGVSLCRHGKEAHSLHQRFQLYRYSYQDVVRYSDMHKYFDCSYIQTYTGNNEKVVHLRPKPKTKDRKLTIRSRFANPSHDDHSEAKKAKLSTAQKPDGTCEDCGIHLLEKRNRFCSVTCKALKQNDNQNSETGSSYITVAEQYEYVEKVSLRKRPRKATPLRSPTS